MNGDISQQRVPYVPYVPNQRVETRKREMFSQKSARRFVGDDESMMNPSAFVMGAMFLASALNRLYRYVTYVTRTDVSFFDPSPNDQRTEHSCA